MSKSNTEIVKIMTPEFRVSFPAVFEPAGMLNQEKKYSVTMLFDKKSADLTAIKAAIRAAVEAKFPDPTKRPKGLKNPLRDGDTDKPDTDGYAGCFFATARSKTRPGLIDAKKVEIIAPEEFYAGCYARATVTVYYYDQAGNKGVGLGLQNIQKLRDGEPFSGRSRPEDDFGTVDAPAGAGASSAKPASEDEMFN